MILLHCTYMVLVPRAVYITMWCVLCRTFEIAILQIPIPDMMPALSNAPVKVVARQSPAVPPVLKAAAADSGAGP